MLKVEHNPVEGYVWAIIIRKEVLTFSKQVPSTRRVLATEASTLEPEEINSQQQNSELLLGSKDDQERDSDLYSSLQCRVEYLMNLILVMEQTFTATAHTLTAARKPFIEQIQEKFRFAEPKIAGRLGVCSWKRFT